MGCRGREAVSSSLKVMAQVLQNYSCGTRGSSLTGKSNHPKQVPEEGNIVQLKKKGVQLWRAGNKGGDDSGEAGSERNRCFKFIS